MQENTTSMELMHGLLKKMNGKLPTLEEGQRVTNERLGAIEHHMAGFHTTVSSQSAEIDGIKELLDRLERRAEISE